MRYKQYTAEEGKVLFNIDSFSWSSNTYCAENKSVRVINMLKEDGIHFNEQYQDMTKNIITEEELDAIKKSILDEIASKGYDISKLIEPVIHE